MGDILLELDLYSQSGGLEFIQEIAHNGVEPAPAIPRLAESIHDHWLRRKQIAWADDLKKQAMDRTLPLDKRMASARQALASIEQESVKDGSVLDGKESVDVYLNIQEDLHRNVGQRRLRLPWSKFSRLVPSLPPGVLIGLLGNPGAGKTALLECVSENWWQQGWRGLYFHLEDSKEYKLHRRAARWTGIPFSVLRDGHSNLEHLTPPEWGAVLKVSEMIAGWPGSLGYVYCPGWTMGQIVAKVEQVSQLGNLDYVVLDYLNKVRYDRRGDLNFTQGRGQDIEDFKSVLERYGLVGLMGGQFDKESKSKKRRRMSDLRDTGELQDKAQVGLIINREELPDGSYSEHCKVMVDKCNFGATGPVDMRMIGPRFLFTDNLSYREEQDQ